MTKRMENRRERAIPFPPCEGGVRGGEQGITISFGRSGVFRGDQRLRDAAHTGQWIAGTTPPAPPFTRGGKKTARELGATCATFARPSFHQPTESVSLGHLRLPDRLLPAAHGFTIMQETTSDSPSGSSVKNRTWS